jgi:hypothetical protein
MSLEELQPEEKVKLAVGMTDVCVRICAEAIRTRNPAIREEDLVERVRERVMYGKRRASGV